MRGSVVQTHPLHFTDEKSFPVTQELSNAKISTHISYCKYYTCNVLLHAKGYNNEKGHAPVLTKHIVK